MDKITNWETYERAEKKIIWQDFFIRILIMVGAIGCLVMAFYALHWFIMAALQTPILFAYGIGGVVGIFYLVYAWGDSRERSKKRLKELKRAKTFQEEAENWNTKMNAYMEKPENETEEAYKTRQRDISHAQTSYEYYIGRRDEAMYEYRRLGGKKYG